MIPPDPVKLCEVYKCEGCSHVDGYLCDMRTCDILEKFLQEKNLGISKNKNSNPSGPAEKIKY
jgi:hypothetical protein